MAVFRASKATLEECYDRIDELGKTTPSVVKRIQELEDFSEYNDEYIRAVCRTPGYKGISSPMLEEEADALVVYNHVPFPEKWKHGMALDHMHKSQLAEMMPSDMSYEVTTLLPFAPTLFKHPKSGKTLNKFTQTHLKGWLPYLLEEINRVKPKVIIAMSTEVVKLLGLKMSNTNERGQIHISPVCGLPVVITLHPKVLNMIRQNQSGGMWGDDYYSVIKRDLHKASDIVHERYALKDVNTAVREASKGSITVCKSIQDVRKWTDFLLSLSATQITSWDLETTSLDGWSPDARILTSQVGYRRPDGSIHAIVFPLWHRWNTYYNADEAFEIHREYLERNSGKVGHNITFDIVFLAATTGVRLKGMIVDTLLALHSLDSGIKGCYSLKTAVWDYLLPTGYGGYEDLLEIEDDNRALLETEVFSLYRQERDFVWGSINPIEMAEEVTENPEGFSDKIIEVSTALLEEESICA